MKHHDHYHCPVCGAEFATEGDVEQHERAQHAQEAGQRDTTQDNTRPSESQGDGSGASDRQNKTFTRTHRE